MDLEQKLIEDLKNGVEVPLERALLIASGCRTEEEIAEYIAKIDNIHKDFQRFRNTQFELNPFEDAFLLFEYFWRKKPARGDNCGNYLLTDVIDAHLSKEKGKVGRCLGLTLLYTVIGQRECLDLNVLADPEHVKTRLRVGNRYLDIENMKSEGFCHYDDLRDFKEYDSKYLISLLFSDRSVPKYYVNDIQGAIKDCDVAIDLHPENAAAHNNRGVYKRYVWDYDGAISDFSTALSLWPNHIYSLFNRGTVWLDLNQYKKAINDFDRVLELNPDYKRAFKCREAALRKLCY